MLWFIDRLEPLCGSTLNWNTRKGVITQWQMHIAEVLFNWTQTQWDWSLIESHWEWCIGQKFTTLLQLRPISAWNMRYMLLQAVHLFKYMLLIQSWSPERGPNIECSIGLAEGTEEDRFEGTSGRTHLQWRRQAYLKELTESYNSSRSLVPALKTQRWNRGSSSLYGPQGPLCHHLEWVPPRCGSSGMWLYPVSVTGAFLVARYDQLDVAVYQVLHVLLAAWGQFVQSTPTLLPWTYCM